MPAAERQKKDRVVHREVEMDAPGRAPDRLLIDRPVRPPRQVVITDETTRYGVEKVIEMVANVDRDRRVAVVPAADYEYFLYRHAQLERFREIWRYAAHSLFGQRLQLMRMIEQQQEVMVMTETKVAMLSEFKKRVRNELIESDDVEIGDADIFSHLFVLQRSHYARGVKLDRAERKIKTLRAILRGAGIRESATTDLRPLKAMGRSSHSSGAPRLDCP